jgi:Protein of unknown function (DUF2726)
MSSPLMTPFLIVIGGILIGLLVRHLKRREKGRLSYARQDFLMPPEDRLFYRSLKDAIGEDYVIFGRIPIDDLITPRGHSGSDPLWNLLTDQGNHHVPFVLCRNEDLSIACAIQLIQHRGVSKGNKKQRHNLEAALKSICVAAGLPLIQLEAGPFYDRLDIQEAIAEAVRREPLFITETDGRKEPKITTLDRLDP